MLSNEPNNVLTALELAAIAQRVDKATPGPWSYKPLDRLEWSNPGVIQGLKRETIAKTYYSRLNDEFIANARDDIPALLKHIEFLEAKIEALMEGDTPHDT